MTARTVTQDAPAAKAKKKTTRRIPAYLVRETIDGIPFYYKGYRSVLRKTKTLEDIMGDSGLQSLLKAVIYDLLRAKLSRKKYWVLSGEVGQHIDRKNNLGLDVVVFDKSVLTVNKITTKYIDVPAKLVVEIDVNAEIPDPSSDLFQEFVVRKLNRLFAFGTPRVVWVFTQSRKILAATPDAPWQFYDWRHDVELTDGITLNLAAYLKQEGIELESEE